MRTILFALAVASTAIAAPSGSILNATGDHDAYRAQAERKIQAWDRDIEQLANRGAPLDVLRYFEARNEASRRDLKELGSVPPDQWPNVQARLEGRFRELKRFESRLRLAE